jgi:hypothetical protein
MMSSMVLVVSSWLETRTTSTGEKEIIIERHHSKIANKTGTVGTLTEVVLTTFLLFQMIPQTTLIFKVGIEIRIEVLFLERIQ